MSRKQHCDVPSTLNSIGALLNTAYSLAVRETLQNSVTVQYSRYSDGAVSSYTTRSYRLLTSLSSLPYKERHVFSKRRWPPLSSCRSTGLANFKPREGHIIR